MGPASIFPGACFLLMEQEVNLFFVVAVKNYGRR
jgi:hypothetical protein